MEFLKGKKHLIIKIWWRCRHFLMFSGFFFLVLIFLYPDVMAVSVQRIQEYPDYEEITDWWKKRLEEDAREKAKLWNQLLINSKTIELTCGTTMELSSVSSSSLFILESIIFFMALRMKPCWATLLLQINKDSVLAWFLYLFFLFLSKPISTISFFFGSVFITSSFCHLFIFSLQFFFPASEFLFYKR